MRTISTDFAPLYRSFIGAEHLASLMDKATRAEKQPAYPPYNIESIADDKYRISMAVAGFVESELDIESKENSLTITGTKQANEDDAKRNFLYQGIAERNFERKFQLADHVKVVSAHMENGLLHIDLEREIPEALKPRKIAINGKSLLEGKTS
ncbi:Hsp20 family protein [Thalassotalea sp. PS06]|uniref:Hsp20 family protein n=1 Tax=Thalassotalea sp. PS06 TaxID=2594005 RepID=UPI0011650B82|nr:Hsp20 family protein [Thalassotalea sp. PS06]QDP01903.1 Hsp20 family protein [Thalassotalea sp. PS06]